MFKSYKYRIYPNKEQKILIDKHIGSCRFIYNLALETKLTTYASSKINLSCFDLQKQLPDLKEFCPWLTEINAQSLQQSISYLDNAFTKFFKGQSDFPKFKKKNSRQSFNIPQAIVIDFDKNKLFIPKFKKRNGIKINLHRKFDGVIKQGTISKTPTGKYFISVLIEAKDIIPETKLIKEETAIGIDLGVKSFLVTSNGLEINNPKYLKNSLKKIKFVQKRYSKFKGKRTKQKLALIHEKIVSQRNDFLNKISTNLINNHDSIIVENLNIAGIIKNHNLAQSISDVSWGRFINMLEYKCSWKGKNLLKIGRFDPSSKTCSNCGNINKELKLEDREWECKKCHSLLDRDLNAAINIKNFGLKNHLSTECRLKNQKELLTIVKAKTSETSSKK